MSLRIDTAELISGAYVIGETGLGVLGSAVPSTGEHGASYLYNDLSLPADNDKEIRGLIVTPPSAGTFYAWEDGSFSLVGAPDGEYTFVYRLYVDGADLGTAVATITLGVLPDGLSGTATLSGITAGGGFAGLIGYFSNAELYLGIGSDLSIRLGGPRMPFWTTGARPATPLDGIYGFNTDTNAIEVWSGSAWV